MSGVIKYIGVVTVSTAGTPQPLSATPRPVTEYLLKSVTGNAGTVFLGDEHTVDNSGEPILSAAKDVFTWTNSIMTPVIDLAEQYVDVSTSADSVAIWAIDQG